MKGFSKILPIILMLAPCFANARDVVSRAARITNTPTSGYTYNYMYPYMNNQMRSTLNPGNANAQSTSPINAVVKTEPLPSTQNTRNVIARSARNNNITNAKPANIRNNVTQSNESTTISRGTTPRTVAPRTAARSARSTSGAYRTNTTTVSDTNSTYVSSSRCLADYTECMNSYCVRNDTPYNRCFCSSRLSQIESKYQPRIDNLIQQILTSQTSGQWTDAEMTEYWNETIGQYIGENTWEKLDNALNINWPTANDRMLGQNAYLTGHQYCIQHIKNCAYAVASMRDVYRSEITRDCNQYEQSLDRLKTALETALETYSN